MPYFICLSILEDNGPHIKIQLKHLLSIMNAVVLLKCSDEDKSIQSIAEWCVDNNITCLIHPCPTYPHATQHQQKYDAWQGGMDLANKLRFNLEDTYFITMFHDPMIFNCELENLDDFLITYKNKLRTPSSLDIIDIDYRACEDFDYRCGGCKYKQAPRFVKASISGKILGFEAMMSTRPLQNKSLKDRFFDSLGLHSNRLFGLQSSSVKLTKDEFDGPIKIICYLEIKPTLKHDFPCDICNCGETLVKSASKRS